MQATAKSSLTHVSTAMTATCHSQLKARCWQVLLSATFIGRGRMQAFVKDVSGSPEY